MGGLLPQAPEGAFVSFSCSSVQAQEGLEEPSHTEGQEVQREEIPLIQGKEQQLCFAGAAVKRNPTSKVRETQGIRGQTH